MLAHQHEAGGGGHFPYVLVRRAPVFARPRDYGLARLFHVLYTNLTQNILSYGIGVTLFSLNRFKASRANGLRCKLSPNSTLRSKRWCCVLVIDMGNRAECHHGSEYTRPETGFEAHA